jgi:hypothetical protein
MHRGGLAVSLPIVNFILGGSLSCCDLEASVEAEILVLCHQVNVLRRKSPKRLAFSNLDRLIFARLLPLRRAL